MLEVNGEKFYRFFDVCSLLYKEKFISDANRLINEGYEASNNIPPVQTLNRTTLFTIILINTFYVINVLHINRIFT